LNRIGYSRSKKQLKYKPRKRSLKEFNVKSKKKKQRLKLRKKKKRQQKKQQHWQRSRNKLLDWQLRQRLRD